MVVKTVLLFKVSILRMSHNGHTMFYLSSGTSTLSRDSLLISNNYELSTSKSTSN